MTIHQTYAVFGLGRYGIAVAEELTASGAEVLAIDIDINKIAEYVAKEAKKDGIGNYDPEELFFIIEGELAYNGIIE